MKKSLLLAVAGLTGGCLFAPAARAQNAPPRPPGTVPGAGVPGASAPGAPAPGTTRTGVTPPAPPLALPGVRTVMVFPFENNTPSGGRALGEALADAIQRGLDASRVYSTVKYNDRSLLVQRAREENPSVMGPAIAGVIDPVRGTVDQARAMQIAQRTGMEAILLGSIEDYRYHIRYDKAANKVEIVGSAQILNPTTGEPLRTAGASGSATGAPGADESTVAQAAATDLAGRLLSGLAVPPPPSITTPTKRPRRQKESQAEEGSRRHFPGWIPAGIILGIIVGAVK